MADTKESVSLSNLAKAGRWDELDRAWMAALERPAPPRSELLSSLEMAVKAKRTSWTETSAWAWLSQVKESESPQAALSLARELLIRLDDGGELRAEVLDLYRKTHTDVPELEQWIERSGLEGKASVRKALRYLDVGLALRPGAFLLHRTDEDAAEVVEVDLAGDSVTLRTPRGTRSPAINQVIEDYKPAAEDDFRVLRTLQPQRIAELAESDPLRLVIGIMRAGGGRIDRDLLKTTLVPRYVKTEKWSDWWTSLRNAVKKSPHVTIEGRSPMFLVYHEAGRTLEEETQEAFDKAVAPRDFLTIVEGYLRESKSRRQTPDAAFLTRVQNSLGERIRRLARPDPDAAFAIALVIERLASEGLPLPADVHGIAVRMMAESGHPVKLFLGLPDLSLWPLAVACARQALPDRWPDVLAQALPEAPSSQCDALARAVEESGRGPELLTPVVERVLADPAEYTEAYMWLWNRPQLKTELPIPPPMDMLNRILMLVGPARHAGKGTAGLTALRAAVRSGFSSKSYAMFRKCLEGKDDSMGAAIRRGVERAEGLGPVVQDEMLEIVRENFPRLWAKAKVAPWDDSSVLYVTQVGRQKKDAEINELVNVKMRENAIAIGNAAERGDLSENSEYKFALEERDLLRARLAQMNMEMSLARVLEPGELPTEHVSIGHRVTARAVDNGEQRVITILGPWESDAMQEIYSYQAPFARRLLGQPQGATITLPYGEGQERQYRIESFEPAI